MNDEEVGKVHYMNILNSIELFLTAVGLTHAWDGFEKTVTPLAHFWKDFLDAPDSEPFELLEGRDQLVVAKNPFYSICSFNLFPFWGTVYTGYLGNGGILELSCVQDNIKRIASEIITQEVLTEDIVVWLTEVLETVNVGVVVKANHFNIKDGLRIQESVSSVMQGAFREEPSVRQEFLSLCKE